MSEVKRYKLLQDVRYDDGAFVIPAGQVVIREADYDVLRDERDRLAELVRQAQPRVCSLLCPSIKARHELWTHTKLCLNMQAALTPATKGERMTHEELVRRIAKPGQEIKDSLSAKDLDLWHHATGVATEAGELLDAAKKVAIYNKPVDRENVIEELGDLEFYMQGIRANLGITREECLAHNIAKLTKRYPKGTFDNADAVARADKHGEQDH